MRWPPITPWSFLRAIGHDLSRALEKLDDQTHRLIRMEKRLSERDGDHVHVREQIVRLDHRIERIERRLRFQDGRALDR